MSRYFESGYIDANYLEGDATEASATLQSQFTITCEPVDPYIESDYIDQNYFVGDAPPGVTHEGAATLSAQFTQTSAITRNRLGASTLNSEFTHSITFTAVRTINLGITASFSVSSQGARTRSTAITMTSQFGVSEAQPTRIKQLSATIGSALSATMTVSALKNHTAVLDSTISIQATAVKTASNTTALANIISLSLQGDRTRATSSTIQSPFSQTTQAQKTTDTTSSQTATTTQTASGDRIRFGASTQTSTFTISASTALVFEPSFTTSSILGSTGLDTVTSLSNTISKTAGASATLAGAFTPSISALATKVGEIVLSSQFRGRNNSNILAKPTVLLRDQTVTVSDTNIFELSSTQAKFGAKSLRINNDPDGTSVDAITVEKKSGGVDIIKTWNTLEFWFYQSNADSSEAQSQIQFVFTDNSNTLFLELQSQAFPERLRLRLFNAGLTQVASDFTSTIFNQWNHARLVVDDGKISIYINGSRVANSTQTTNLNTSTDHEFQIRATTSSSTFVDELRISDVAINDVDDTSFTVPTQAFANNLDSTIALFHFDTAIADDNEFDIVEAATLTANTTQTATANYGPGVLASSLSSAFTHTVTAVRTFDVESNNTATSTLSASFDRIKGISATITAQSTQSAQINAVRSGASSQSVQIAQTTQAVKQVSVTADFDAINIVLSAASKIGDFLIAYDVAFSQSATAHKTTDITKTINTEFTQSATAIKTVVADSTIQTAFTHSTQGDRIRFASSTQNTIISMTCDAVETDSFASDFAVAFSLSCETSGIRSTGAELSSTHTASITAIKKIDITKTISTEFTQTATVQAGLFGDVELDSAFSLSLTPSVTRTFDATFDAINTQITVVARTAAFFINHDIVSTISITADRTRDITVNINSEAGVDTTAFRIKPLSASITSTATLTAVGVTQQDSESAMTSQFSQSTTAIKTVSSEADLLSENAFALTALVARGGDIDLISTTSVQASVDRQRNTSAVKSVVVSMSTNAGIQADAAAGIIATVTLTADTAVIHISDTVYKIPAETRTHKIRLEKRNYQINTEQRTHKLLRKI